MGVIVLLVDDRCKDLVKCFLETFSPPPGIDKPGSESALSLVWRRKESALVREAGVR